MGLQLIGHAVSALCESRNSNVTVPSGAASPVTDRRYRIPQDREAMDLSTLARLRLPVSPSARHVVAGAGGVQALRSIRSR